MQGDEKIDSDNNIQPLSPNKEDLQTTDGDIQKIAESAGQKPLYKPHQHKKIKYALSLFSVFFLVAGLITSIYLVQQQQKIEERAAGHCTPGIVQCSGYRQSAKCIPANEQCPTRDTGDIYPYPTWCGDIKECSISEKCLEGICVQIPEDR